MAEHTVYWFAPGEYALDEDTLDQQLSPAAAHLMRGQTTRIQNEMVAVRLFEHAQPQLVVQIASTCGFELVGEEVRREPELAEEPVY
jgi:hypothetical protein